MEPKNASTPAEVWQMVVRADELIKYASNRDPATAYLQAREELQRALLAAGSLTDGVAAENLGAQIRTRLDDLAARGS
jgi:hypothetical protein